MLRQGGDVFTQLVYRHGHHIQRVQNSGTPSTSNTGFMREPAVLALPGKARHCGVCRTAPLQGAVFVSERAR